MSIATETFSIEFDGAAFDKHEISASSLAQSLLALDALSQTAANKLYGKETSTEVKVKAELVQARSLSILLSKVSKKIR